MKYLVVHNDYRINDRSYVDRSVSLYQYMVDVAYNKYLPSGEPQVYEYLRLQVTHNEHKGFIRFRNDDVSITLWKPEADSRKMNVVLSCSKDYRIETFHEKYASHCLNLFVSLLGLRQLIDAPSIMEVNSFYDYGLSAADKRVFDKWAQHKPAFVYSDGRNVMSKFPNFKSGDAAGHRLNAKMLSKKIGMTLANPMEFYMTLNKNRRISCLGSDDAKRSCSIERPGERDEFYSEYFCAAFAAYSKACAVRGMLV